MRPEQLAENRVVTRKAITHQWAFCWVQVLVQTPVPLWEPESATAKDDAAVPLKAG